MSLLEFMATSPNKKAGLLWCNRNGGCIRQSGQLGCYEVDGWVVRGTQVPWTFRPLIFQGLANYVFII